MPINNYQPSLVVTQFIALTGVFPPRDAPLGAPPPDEQASYYSLGMIRMFAGNFDPGADLAAQGQLLSIASNTALFSIIGTMYGGNGTTNFALPNLSGRAAVGSGQGPGLTDRYQGEQYGSAQVNLLTANMPASSGGSSIPFSNDQPALATNYVIRAYGSFQGGPGSVAIGGVVQFAGNFTPSEYIPCDGRLLSIAENDVLFALIGTTYGGDGQTTFAVPDLRGRSVVGTGAGVDLGEQLGSSQLSLTSAVMPSDMGGGGGQLDNHAPGLGLNYLIATQGIYPSRDSGGAPYDAQYLGEIISFAGSTPPSGYARCEGQLLSIAQNQALFSLLGTMYGGDGITTFALPDLRGRVALGSNDGLGFQVGQTFGQTQITLSSDDIPPLTINGTDGADLFYGGGSGDTISGLNGADELRGNGGGDTLLGGAGNDILIGGLGADVLTGGIGTDTVSYSGSSSGVTVRLFSATATGGEAQGDTFSSIENITGSSYADDLAGTNVVNQLEGGTGDDILNGRGGADMLFGGSGIDTVTYVNSSAGVTIRLNGGLNQFGEAEGDTFDSIENVVGSAYTDALVGSSGANRIEGGGSADYLNGGGGADVILGGVGADQLVGGAGDDVLTGGTGADKFDFRSAGGGFDTITDFVAGNVVSDVIWLNSALFADFADLMAHTTDDGLGNTVIAKGSLTITVQGVVKSQFRANDFDIAAAAPDLEADSKPDQPLILPSGLETKVAPDEAPVVCPPGEAGLLAAPTVWDLAEMGLSDFGGRDPHRFLIEPRGLDWIV